MFGRYGNNLGDTAMPRLDASTEAAITTAMEHHEIHEGRHYFVVNFADLTANQVLDFTWLMPDTARLTHWTWEIETEAELLWQVYEGAAETNALANTMTPLNSNRNSDNTSGTVMKYEIQTNIGGANADTDISGGILMQAGKTGAGRKTGGSAIRGHELMLKRAELYCLRATATEAGYINFSMNWYEHSDRHG